MGLKSRLGVKLFSFKFWSLEDTCGDDSSICWEKTKKKEVKFCKSVISLPSVLLFPLNASAEDNTYPLSLGRCIPEQAGSAPSSGLTSAFAHCGTPSPALALARRRDSLLNESINLVSKDVDRAHCIFGQPHIKLKWGSLVHKLRILRWCLQNMITKAGSF